MWHVSSRSGVATLRTAIHLLLTYLQTHRQTHRQTGRQRAELHRAALVVERKPLDVDGACRDEESEWNTQPTVTFPAAGGDEESEWNPRDCAGRVDDRVGRKLAVDVLVRAARHTHDAKSSIYRLNKHRDK